MFETTINEAVKFAVDDLRTEARILIGKIHDDAIVETHAMRKDVNDRLEFGAFVIGGAVIVGLLLAAIVIRVGGD
jgi:hypothetical protein